MTLAPTLASIDLGALCRNYQRLARQAAPAKVLAVVKAHAYGHGTIPVARAVIGAGACGLGVTAVEEAMALRDAQIDTPILVLGGAYDGAHADLIARDIQVAVGRAEDVKALAATARSRGVRARVHVKIDTGMSRLGCRPELLPALFQACADDAIEVVGVMTHLAAADEEDLSGANAQLKRFDECLESFRGNLGTAPIVHAANTAGTLRLPHGRRDMVRLGIGLYGVRPSSRVPDPGLEPVLAVRTRIIAIRSVEPGDAVGYGSHWRAQHRSRIATLPIGYGDGYLRRLSSRAQVLVRGRRVPVVGAISMDLMMIDVTDTGAEHGDEVVLVGRQGEDRITLEEVAGWAETIPYEILVGLARRVPRKYTGAEATE